MTLDDLFLNIKKKYDVSTIEGYNNEFLRKLYLKKLRYALSSKMNEIGNEEFFNYLWDGDGYKRFLHNGGYTFKASAWDDEAKVAYIKEAINKYYNDDEKKQLLAEIENTKLPIDEVGVINNAPQKLEEQISKENGETKALLIEIKNVVFQNLDTDSQDYFLNLAKTYENVENEIVDKNILKHKDDSNLTKVFVKNFFDNDKYEYKTIN